MKLPRPARYPATLTIKDEEYRIAFVERIEGKDMLGQCDGGNRVIHIKKGMTRQETFKTFLHEILHAIEFEYSIKISHKTVYKLEEAVFQVLMDNF